MAPVCLSSQSETAFDPRGRILTETDCQLPSANRPLRWLEYTVSTHTYTLCVHILCVDVFYTCVFRFVCVCSSEGGGSEAGGDSQRSDVSFPPARRLQHSQRNRNLWSPLWTTGEAGYCLLTVSILVLECLSLTFYCSLHLPLDAQ